jgi:cytochrome c biogenesis protein
MEFLGSMSLAVTILVVLAVASVIGTVLQQNQPYTAYISKFGSYWHEIFKILGLYDVYGSLWFILLLGFLVLSISVCIYRNTPVMLRDMRQFRIRVSPKSLRLMHNVEEWDIAQTTASIQHQVEHFFQQQSYRFKIKVEGELTILSAMKGGMNRMGYIFTHTGMLIIFVGGLLDGNLALAYKEWRGQLQLETRDIPASDVPAISRLKPSDNISFRGSITIPEGNQANLVFLNVRDGYLIQELPFSVKLKAFRIEHYESGQPKSFESDLVIYDEDRLDNPLEQTISVNHPLVYEGYAIYQASFADGGSSLKLKALPFYKKSPEPFEITVKVNSTHTLETPRGDMALEITEFKENNVFPATEKEHKNKKFINYGPSFQFKLRDVDGQAKEYQTFQVPLLQDGRYFFVTGMRTSPAEQFRFLHIPMDENGSMGRFMAFHAIINDAKRIQDIARKSAENVMGSGTIENRKLQQDVITTMIRLLELYNIGGYVALDKHIRESIPKDKQLAVAEAFLKILQNLLRDIYIEVLQDEGIDVSQDISQEQGLFFDDAVNALAGIGVYDSPFYLQMVDFELREASGLQITRSPGKNIVYFGSVMLIIGIFLMFYIAHQRLWIVLTTKDEHTGVIFSGAGNRNQRDFTKHFTELTQILKSKLNHR